MCTEGKRFSWKPTLQKETDKDLLTDIFLLAVLVDKLDDVTLSEGRLIIV